jgi:hypothetical protein
VDRDRQDQIRRFELEARRWVLLTLAGAIPLAASAVVDLITGALIDDRRIDIALLVAVGLGIWGSLSFYALANRMKRSELPERMSPLTLAWLVFSLIVIALATAGVGYLIAGWIGVGVFLGGLVVFTAVIAAYGARQRPCAS